MSASPAKSRLSDENKSSLDPTRVSLSIGDGEFGGWMWDFQASAPTLVFAHATGFNASAYKSLLGNLAGQVRIIAVNQRGHGTTRLRADPDSLLSWETYAADMLGLLDNLNCGPVHYAGHSMGAIVGLLAASLRPDLFRSLTLFDPVLMSPSWYRLMRTPLWYWLRRRITLAATAEKRRNTWPDRQSVMLSYQGRGIFRSLSAQVLQDYLEDGLDETDNGVELACDPAWEAATFRAQRHLIWPAIRRLSDIPLTIVKPQTGSTFLVNPQRVLDLQPQTVMHTMLNCGHFAPLEQPEEARQYLLQGMGMYSGGTR